MVAFLVASFCRTAQLPDAARERGGAFGAFSLALAYFSTLSRETRQLHSPRSRSLTYYANLRDKVEQGS